VTDISALQSAGLSYAAAIAFAKEAGYDWDEGGYTMPTQEQTDAAYKSTLRRLEKK
jgi:hypothetical protein